MHPLGFKLFTDTLKNRGNIIFLCLAVMFTIDYLTGGRIMAEVTGFILRLQKIDSSADAIRINTIFGVFTSVTVWTAFIERVLMVIFFAIPGFSIIKGLYSSLSGK